MLTSEEWGIVLLSLQVGAVAMAATLPVAFTLAWILARVRFPGKVLLDAAVHLPLVVPPVVTGWVLLLAFAPRGVIGAPLEALFGVSVLFRWTGAAIAAAVMALPLTVRAMRLSIEAVDQRLESAARTLGAGRARVFWTITLPLSVPGILAGAVPGRRGLCRWRSTARCSSRAVRRWRGGYRGYRSRCHWRLWSRRKCWRGGWGRGTMSFDVALTKRIGTTEIALTLEPGPSAGPGATILFGRSGVGKTSVLNMVAGLLRPDAGHVRVGGETLFGDGVDVLPERRRAGYVFQEPRLFPHLRVRGNLLYGAPRGAEIGDRLDFLGIGGLLDRWPRTLSGGEARRVAIGRVLLSDPRFLLLDEPLSSLDRPRREEVMQAIEHMRDVLRLPILMVTHDPEEAERLGTRVVRMG
jgi:molybdate transport system ATP-binding protein